MSATTGVTIDTARLAAMLTQLSLPTIARLWQAITETADRESWPAAKTLAALFEHEIAERAQRRTARHLLEARLPAGKTIDRFDFAAAPSVSKARIMALAEGDAWLTKGMNILIFGPPGVGKSHLGAALGHAMIDAGNRVLFTRTTDLVQHLQAARQDLKLATALEKLDKYHLLVLDDLSTSRRARRDQRHLRTDLRPLRAPFLADHRESAFRRMGCDLPGSRHDRRRDRPPGASLDHSGDEHRQLPAQIGRN
jgi:DNA replication protein DnaC